MTFLPKDYKAPTPTGNYMRLEDGQNRFRILSEAITGYEYWNTSNKPVRSKENWKTIPADIRIEPNGQPSKIKHFWAFKVWNYATSSIQILQITQASIQGAMKIKLDNRDGDAFGYDFLVTRTGKGIETEYDVDTGEKLPLDPQIVVKKNTTHIDLEALFRGEDPFKAEKPSSEPENAPSDVVGVTDGEINVEDIPF